MRTEATAPRTGPMARHVSKKIRFLLIEKDLQQQQLAERMGVYDSWLSRRLKGQTPITVDDLALFAKALETTPAELVKGRPTNRYVPRRPVDNRPISTRPTGSPLMIVGRAA